MKRQDYERKISKLIEVIDKKVKSSLPKEEQSNQIMARLREEYIFVKNSYVRSFENYSLATINPFSDDVKLVLEEGDEEGKDDDEYCRIDANSFGPFNPVEYFKDGNFRILWILKEPYVKTGEYEDFKLGRRTFLGGHDQAYQYYDEGWGIIKLPAKDGGNPTIANLIRITRVILEKKGVTFNVNDEEEIMIKVMNHICILEANHFPGLAFNSTDSYNASINDWLKYNEKYLGKCIELYNPNLVIIGGKCAMYDLVRNGHNETDSFDSHFFNWIRVSNVENVEGEYYIFGRKIENSQNRKVMDKSGFKEDTQRAAVFRDEKGTTWFPWYHPAPRNYTVYWDSKWEKEEKNTLSEICEFLHRNL